MMVGEAIASQDAIKGNHNSITDSRFKLIAESKLTVPKNYNHSKQLSTLKKKDFFYFDGLITDKNFKRVTNKLQPGRKYTVKMFGIKRSKKVNSEDCLAFLKKHHAILIGAQGESLLWKVDKRIFPLGKCTLSFDVKNALFKNSGGDTWIPYIYRYVKGDWEFELDHFDSDFDSDYCLLCVSNC